MLSENHSSPARYRRSPWLTVAGCVAIVLSLCAVYFALITYGAMSTAQEGDYVTPLLAAQLAVAVAGLLPAAALGRATYRGDGAASVFCLGLGILVYLAWGILNDASVHGWANLRVF